MTYNSIPINKKNRRLCNKPDYFVENNLESDSSPENWTNVDALDRDPDTHRQKNQFRMPL